MMLMQRLEMLSTKPWGQAEEALAPLQGDAAAWRSQAQTLLAHTDWVSADPKYPAQLDAATQQMAAMFEAFSAALTAAKNAAQNPEAALPAVPVWAEEIRAARGTSPHAEPPATGESKASADAQHSKPMAATSMRKPIWRRKTRWLLPLNSKAGNAGVPTKSVMI
jgi:hypothetical protein